MQLSHGHGSNSHFTASGQSSSPGPSGNSSKGIFSQDVEMFSTDATDSLLHQLKDNLNRIIPELRALIASGVIRDNDPMPITRVTFNLTVSSAGQVSITRTDHPAPTGISITFGK
ncbi:hypothetical protein [Pseudonocardia charpentierae]|uniref:Uncharacterized protein n=1 Tax=Pseudonocardia charpentierae TaxID=3075545 RepID=A0ABU2NKU3_9PSEU|nr:hypothetical protein [Pseudonocardia sp. DSM 45834]MDT0353633.1 hypothetical protein [Pseudonocardia sp. DSM 45834]